MRELALKTVGVIWTTFWVILLAPFLIPAYGIARLLGADPFSLDGMGVGFLVMGLVAGGLVIASLGFVLGTLF